MFVKCFEINTAVLPMYSKSHLCCYLLLEAWQKGFHCSTSSTELRSSSVVRVLIWVISRWSWRSEKGKTDSYSVSRKQKIWREHWYQTLNHLKEDTKYRELLMCVLKLLHFSKAPFWESHQVGLQAWQELEKCSICEMKEKKEERFTRNSVSNWGYRAKCSI